MSLWNLGAKLAHRMPWVFQYLSLFLPFAMSVVSVVDSGVKMQVYWNSTNPIFNNSGSLDTKFGDTIEILCPKYPASTPDSEKEFYVIYLYVEKHEYDTCRIADRANVKLILNCTTTPFITIFVQKFAGIPFQQDFVEKKYYIISTSTGTLNGLDNQVEGVCEKLNMKLVLNVCCNDTSTSAPSNNTATTGSPPMTPTPTPSPTTKQTVTTATTTRTTTTTVTTTNATTTTLAPTSTTTNFPGGLPSDPSKDIIIDATDKNSGIISSAKTLQPPKLVLCISSIIVTLLLLLR